MQDALTDTGVSGRTRRPAGAPVVGLLGGVGSGKSTVARLLAGHGARVLDADRAAQEVLASPPVRAALRRAWGAGVIGADGRPDRSALARVVFNNPRALRRLNRLVHPRVVERLRRETSRLRRGRRPVVLDVPLLVETPLRRLVTVWVFVETPAAQRARRTARDRGWAPGEAARRERFQSGLALKRRLADVVIDNGGGPAATARQVTRLARALAGPGPRSQAR
jgi:dephospho-CoA kinase